MLTEPNHAGSRDFLNICIITYCHFERTKHKINIPITFKENYVFYLLYNKKFALVTYFSEVFNIKLG